MLAGTTKAFEQSYTFDLAGNRLRKITAQVASHSLPSGWSAGTTRSDYNARDQRSVAESLHNGNVDWVTAHSNGHMTDKELRYMYDGESEFRQRVLFYRNGQQVKWSDVFSGT